MQKNDDDDDQQKKIWPNEFVVVFFPPKKDPLTLALNMFLSLATAKRNIPLPERSTK